MTIFNGFILRFILVGIFSNLIIFFLYIILTYFGFGPKFAMSLLYSLGVLQTFVFNKKWSFRFNGPATPALVRYITAYAAGYVINFVALVVLVDQAGLPHQAIQAVMIVVVAGLLFLAQRFWVFPRSFESKSS